MNNAITLVDLCNLAMRRIGAKRIDSLEESSESAQACSDVIKSVLRTVQGLMLWPELVKTQRIAPTGVRLDGRGAQFNRPLDCLRIVDVGAGRGRGFEEEDGYVYVPAGNSASVPCRYIRYSENPAEWSEELKHLVVCLLSARVLASKTKNMADAESLEDKFWNIERPRAVARVLRMTKPRREYESEEGLF